jgi:ABC-2 type transport system ATP-binding protein
MTISDMPAVSVDGVGKRYRALFGRSREQWALRDCTLELPRGRVAALVGANGAGKTTLLTILAGLVDPTEGATNVDGRIAYVAQEKPVYRGFTALDMLRVGAHLNTRWDQRRALRWLERFDVPTNRPCGKLSGGQRAQVAFAIALGSQPSVLLLDEPLANLDPLVRTEVTAELLTEVTDTGLTVLLSTHVVGELGGVADRLLLLAGGRLVLDGDLDELLRHHVRWVGPRSDTPPATGEILRAKHVENQSTFLVRLAESDVAPVFTEPWTSEPMTVEDVVLTHLAATRSAAKELAA